jgi:hypothetical protein
MFFIDLARGCNTTHHAWKIRGHAREFTYPLPKASIIAQPSIADPWALPKRNLTFTEHMAGQIKHYLQAHALAYITYIRSARSCQVYLNHSRSPHHQARASVQLYNNSPSCNISPRIAAEAELLLRLKTRYYTSL